MPNSAFEYAAPQLFFSVEATAYRIQSLGEVVRKPLPHTKKWSLSIFQLCHLTKQMLTCFRFFMLQQEARLDSPARAASVKLQLQHPSVQKQQRAVSVPKYL